MRAPRSANAKYSTVREGMKIKISAHYVCSVNTV